MIKGLIEQYLGPRPKKVNCWYCGQDSYLLPGSGMTPNSFFCNICESENNRDANGDILDNRPPESQPDQSDDQGHCVKTELQVSSKELCENCLADQRMNRMYLNQYIPHENDPSYQSRWESAQTYEQYLDEKTPLCKNCQIKVDKFNAAQEKRLPKRLDIKDRHDDEKNAPSFHLLNPSQKSAVVYAASQYLWYSVHIFALVVNAYGYRYPPTGTQVDDLQDNIPVMASGGNDGSANMLKLATMTLFSKLGRGIACLLSIQSKQGECAITSDYTVLYYIVNIASILVLYWHPLVSLEFEGGDPKAKYYDIYKAFQILLFVYRMGFPILLHYVPSKSLLGFIIIYISIHCFSTSCVQVQGYRVLKRVGKNLVVDSNTPSPIVTPSSSKMRSSRYINDDLKEAMIYKRKDTVDYRDTIIERDDDVHRATYDFNKLKL